MYIKYCFLVFLISFLLLTSAHAQLAIFKGKVQDEEGKAVVGATVRIAELASGVVTDTAGIFRFQVPAGKALTYIFSHIGYQEKRYAFTLASGQQFDLTVVLERETRMLGEVEVKSGKVIKLRPEISITKIASPDRIRRR